MSVIEAFGKHVICSFLVEIRSISSFTSIRVSVGRLHGQAVMSLIHSRRNLVKPRHGSIMQERPLKVVGSCRENGWHTGCEAFRWLRGVGACNEC